MQQPICPPPWTAASSPRSALLPRPDCQRSSVGQAWSPWGPQSPRAPAFQDGGAGRGRRGSVGAGPFPRPGLWNRVEEPRGPGSANPARKSSLQPRGLPPASAWGSSRVGWGGGRQRAGERLFLVPYLEGTVGIVQAGSRAARSRLVLTGALAALQPRAVGASAGTGQFCSFARLKRPESCRGVSGHAREPGVCAHVSVCGQHRSRAGPWVSARPRVWVSLEKSNLIALLSVSVACRGIHVEHKAAPSRGGLVLSRGRGEVCSSVQRSSQHAPTRRASGAPFAPGHYKHWAMSRAMWPASTCELGAWLLPSASDEDVLGSCSDPASPAGEAVPRHP